MYITQSNACTVPNGSTPVSTARIAAAQALLSRINREANNAQGAFAGLLCRTDLNSNGWPLAEFPDTAIAPCSSDGAVTGTPGISPWPAQLSFQPSPAGVAPTSISAYAAPPAPPMPSLVTQGRPRWNPKTKSVTPGVMVTVNIAPPPNPGTAPAPTRTRHKYTPPPAAAPQAPVCTQYPYASAAYINCVEAMEQSGQELTTSSQTFGSIYKKGLAGMGCAEGSSPCDILLGMISAVGLAAASVYLYDYFKRSGGLSF